MGELLDGGDAGSDEFKSSIDATLGISERMVEMAGPFGDISCVHDPEQGVVLRVRDRYRRPEGLVEILGNMLGVMPLVSDGKMDVDCPRLSVNRCVSCPKNARGGSQASRGAGLGLDPAAVQRMTEGAWNSGSVE